MDDYETPNVLADAAKAWLCELTKTSVFNLEIRVDGNVAKAAKEEEEKTENTQVDGEVAKAAKEEDQQTDDTQEDDEMLYCTGFAVEAKDGRKLRILTTFRLMEKYEKSVVKTFGNFELDSIKKAFDFAFICSHAEDKYYNSNSAESKRFYQLIQMLDVYRRNSLVMLEMDVEDVEICQMDHRGLKMANSRPPKGQECLFRAWPCLCPNVILWRSVSNNIDRDSTRIFPSRSGDNMKLTQFGMTWEDDETAKDEGVEQYSGCPVIDGNGDCFGVFYGVHKWRGYAIALEVKGFLRKH